LEKKLLPLHHRLNKQTINRESVFIYLGYNGKNYCGWQVQPNGVTVQQCLEEALGILLRKPVPVVGAGRTDAGVHARLMVAHFDWETEITDLSHLAGKLNRLLPKDIAVYNIVPVVSDAHARFSATSRTYNYYITDKKDPLITKLYINYRCSPILQK
jgi:Pseudouridylate synthase